MSEMITAKDVQTMLQVDRSTVYRMAEDGRLPAVKVGRQWRFRATDIHAMIGRDGAHAVQKPPAPSTHTSSNLSNVLPLECVQQVQDGFAEALGVMIIITDMVGEPITRESNPCGLFTALHNYPQVWQTCVEHWRDMAAKPTIAPQFTTSSMGLLCARALIRVGSSLEGMVFLGGIAPAEWPPSGEALDGLVTHLGVDCDVLQPHLDDVFFIDKAERARLLPLAQRIADIVSHMASEFATPVARSAMA